MSFHNYLSGVEVLITTDNLKKWIKNIDYNNSGTVEFKICKIFKNIEFNYISIYSFNEIFNLLDYEKIFCFGNKIYLKSKNNYYLIISLSKYGYFTEKITNSSCIMFELNENQLYYNDILYFTGTISFVNNTKVSDNIIKQIKNSLEWRDKDLAFKFTRKCRNTTYRSNSLIYSCIANSYIVKGINEIYISEALFETKTPIGLKIKDIKDKKIFEIISSCQEIMKKSYLLGGVTTKGKESFGIKGYGKKILKVYEKAGCLCEKCKSGIIQLKKTKIRGGLKMKIYYCPICQSEKKHE